MGNGISEIEKTYLEIKRRDGIKGTTIEDIINGRSLSRQTINNHINELKTLGYIRKISKGKIFEVLKEWKVSKTKKSSNRTLFPVNKSRIGNSELYLVMYTPIYKYIIETMDSIMLEIGTSGLGIDFYREVLSHNLVSNGFKKGGPMIFSESSISYDKYTKSSNKTVIATYEFDDEITAISKDKEWIVHIVDKDSKDFAYTNSLYTWGVDRGYKNLLLILISRNVMDNPLGYLYYRMVKV